MYSDFYSLSREKKRVRQTDDVEGRWKRKVVPDSWVRVRLFVQSQKPCGAEVGDMTCCENNNTPWQNSSLCKHPPPQSWRMRNTNNTCGTTCHQRGLLTTDRCFKFTLQHQCTLNSSCLVQCDCLLNPKPADRYVERCRVLKI